MAKIFLDVGGYHGESARAGLDPRFGFDKVYCFEPVRASWERIKGTLHDPRLEVVHAGLLDQTTTAPVYGAGSLGGTVYTNSGEAVTTGELCSFIEASEFFKQKLRPTDRVWMKLNCEGAEVGVLLNLFATGEHYKLTHVLIDLDARRFPSLNEKLAHLKRELESAPFAYSYPEDVQYSMITNFGSIRNWLIVTGAIEPGIASFARSLRYQTFCALDQSINGYYKMRLLRALGLRPRALVPTRPGAMVDGRSNPY